MGAALKWVGGVLSVMACAWMATFVVAAWFALDAGHGFAVAAWFALDAGQGCTRVSNVIVIILIL